MINGLYSTAFVDVFKNPVCEIFNDPVIVGRILYFWILKSEKIRHYHVFLSA